MKLTRPAGGEIMGGEGPRRIGDAPSLDMFRGLEDVGGVWGYAEFLEAIKDPIHERHTEMVEWAGGDFDPEDILTRQGEPGT